MASQEGKYVIQTEELDLSAVQAVEAYKDLSEIERSFRELKDLVEMRPIYHRRPKRVRAHIFVAALAFLLACHGLSTSQLHSTGINYS
jgi:transposase